MSNPVFASIIGNDPIKVYLTRMVEKGNIVHSLLFAGPAGVGKGRFAEALASLLLAEKSKIPLSRPSADLRIYRPEGKTGMHTIDAMRQFSAEVAMPPFESPRKVFIIHDADRMMTASANALLKTFEEPSSHSIIILLSTSPELLLPTVRSRCCTIRFQGIPDAGTTQKDNPVIEALLRQLMQGRFKTYTQLLKSAEELTDLIEEAMKQVEEDARESLAKHYPPEPTKIQQEELDKEVEGVVAMRLAQEASALLDQLLAWYRDLHLLQVEGNLDYLIHKEHVGPLQQALQKGEILPLETVQKAIAQMRLALARSTPLRNCLEALFLQLRF